MVSVQQAVERLAERAGMSPRSFHRRFHRLCHAGQFSKAFVRRFGLNPGLFREMHAANPD